MSGQEWLDAVESVDQATVEKTGQEYPYAQWVNGRAGLKSAGGVAWTGGWFIPEGQFDESVLLAAGWVKGDLDHDDNTSTAGYFMRDITVAVVRWRRRLTVKVPGERRERAFAWTDWEMAKKFSPPKGRLNLLVSVKGLNTGPMVLTVGGMVAREFTDQAGVLGTFSRGVVGEANMLNAKRGKKNKFPYRAFWLSVGPQRKPDGTPDYTEVGKQGASSRITLPTALGIKAMPEPGDLSKLFVGADKLAELNDLYAQTAEWVSAWDKTPQVAVEVEPVPNGDAAAEEELPF